MRVVSTNSKYSVLFAANLWKVHIFTVLFCGYELAEIENREDVAEIQVNAEQDNEVRQVCEND